jgi:F0F1-type ATP synthase assembly protein I
MHNPMTRELEAALALIFIVISGYCLWAMSYVTGALAATIAQAIAVGLYIHSQRKKA